MLLNEPCISNIGGLQQRTGIKASNIVIICIPGSWGASESSGAGKAGLERVLRDGPLRPSASEGAS